MPVLRTGVEQGRAPSRALCGQPQAAYHSGVTMVEVTLADGSVTLVPYPRVPPVSGIGTGRRQERWPAGGWCR